MIGTVAPELIIENCEFKNIGFNMRSLIEVNSGGSHITITDSKFSNMASCGSIISNVNPYYRNDSECTSTFTTTSQ